MSQPRRPRAVVAVALLLGVFTTLALGARAHAQAHGNAQPSVDAEPIEVLVEGPPSPVALGADDTSARFTLGVQDMLSPGSTLPELLSRSPGVELTRAGGSADLASLAVRGGSAAQLPIYLGGVRLDDELTGSVDLSTLPIWMLHRVVLHRGHSGIHADRLGVAGALMLVPRIARRPEGRLRLGLSSFGGRSIAASGAVGDGDSGAMTALRYRRGRGDFAFLDDRGTAFDPTDDRLRRRRNADHQQLDSWSSATVRLPGGQLKLLVHTFWREAGVPGLQLVGSRAARSSVQRLLGAASVTLPCYGGASDCRLHLDSGLLRSRYRLSDPLLEIGPEAQVVTQGVRFTQRLRVALTLEPHTTLWLGTGFEGGRLSQQRGQSAVRHSGRVVLRPEFAVVSAPLPQLRVAMQGALNCHTTRAATAGGECGVMEPVGRVGARWRLLPRLNVFANAGRYVRVPTLGELFGVTATVRGNDNLKPERGVMLDAGIGGQWQGDSAGAFAQLVGFARWAEDLIVYRRSSLGAVTPYNAASARVLGLEGAVGGRWGHYLRVRGAVTVMDPRDLSDSALENNILPLRSRLTGFARAALRTPSWPRVGLSFAEVAVSYRHRSARYVDPAGLIALPVQHLVALDVALQWQRQRLSLRGRIANLLDRRHVDLLGYPLPGRAYHGSMEARW